MLEFPFRCGICLLPCSLWQGTRMCQGVVNKDLSILSAIVTDEFAGACSFLLAGLRILSLLQKQLSHPHISVVPLPQTFHGQRPRTSAEQHTAAASACRMPLPAS